MLFWDWHFQIDCGQVTRNHFEFSNLKTVLNFSIDTLTSSDQAMRLPGAISPYKLAIVMPKVEEEHAATKFTRDLITQLSSLHNLTGDILVDDRLSKSVGRRLNELNQLGIPNIVVVPAKKSAKPHDLIEMEFFRFVFFQKIKTFFTLERNQKRTI